MKSVFRYPPMDEDPYLTWFSDSFTSVFVAANPFLRIPDHPRNKNGDWIPHEVNILAKKRGLSVGVSWHEIANLCRFGSIAHVARALRLTGSKRVAPDLACPEDTAKMLEICDAEHIFLPDEGYISPVAELSLAAFLKALEQDEVFVAHHFGHDPQPMASKDFLLPKELATPEIHTADKSLFLVIYIDYHYFLICQTDESRSKANPADYFEGFYADADTNDLWGVGDLS